MQKNSIILILLFSMNLQGNPQTIPRRNKPVVNDNFNGKGFILLLGGTKGKYFKTYRLDVCSKKIIVHKPAPIKKVIVQEASLPMPSLKIDFIGATDRFKDSICVDEIIKPLGEYLQKNMSAKINLIGNTGVTGDPKAPVGSGLFVYNSKTTLNGKSVRTEEVMIARAEAVKEYLAIHYDIKRKRIKTLAGTQEEGEQNRIVGVALRKSLF